MQEHIHDAEEHIHDVSNIIGYISSINLVFNGKLSIRALPQWSRSCALGLFVSGSSPKLD